MTVPYYARKYLFGGGDTVGMNTLILGYICFR
jgi:hypothetical protein